MGRPVLELEQLRLRYPGSDTWTLDGLNLSLEPGRPSPWWDLQAVAKARWRGP